MLILKTAPLSPPESTRQDGQTASENVLNQRRIIKPAVREDDPECSKQGPTPADEIDEYVEGSLRPETPDDGVDLLTTEPCRPGTRTWRGRSVCGRWLGRPRGGGLRRTTQQLIGLNDLSELLVGDRLTSRIVSKSVRVPTPDKGEVVTA
jgi:hypothetical protein